MKYGKLLALVIISVVAIALLMPAASQADDVTLYPGYIDGTVTIGDLNISSVSVSASGGGFSSSKSVSGNTYSLTVQTGDFDHTFSANALIRPQGTYYPYTNIYFNSRTIHVPENTTVQNDYSVDYGTVRFEFNITGDPYSSWYVRAYANRYVSPPAERTYSYTYTNSSYSPDGAFDMYVVPNQQIQIYAYLYIDGKLYYINAYPDYYYADIAAGETVVIPVDIIHEAPTQADTGTIQGTIELANIENLDYHRVYSSVSGDYQNQYIYDNPGTYLFENAQAVSRYVYAQTYMNGYRTYLWWPYINGDSNNNRIDVAPGQSYTLDFIADTGVLTGDITFTGTLKNEDMEYYYLNAQGTRIYVPGTGWVNQPTYGGSSYDRQYGSDPDNTYKLFLPPGQWNTYYTYARSYDTDLGYANRSYMYLYDYTKYYDGNYYNFGQNANITAGQTTVQDIDYCTGSLLLRFKDASGGLLRNPRVSGYARTYNDQNRQVTQWSVNGYSYAPLMAHPEAEVHGPDGLYDLTCAAYTEDGSYVTFARINVELECGVKKGRDLSGPEITVETPAAESITNAQTVTVSGTATDDAGVASIEVNGIPVSFQSTGNPDDLNEVSFSYNLSVTSGDNTITVTASDTLDNQASDTRHIYVDHWMPTVTINSPADGTHYSHLTDQISFDVQAADQGYGFTLTVSFDGQEIASTTGGADDTVPVSVSISDIIQGPLAVGDHVITAEAADVAGNITVATSTITVYLAADIEVKPEATHNVLNGTSTIFIQLPNGLTATASLNITDNREITAIPDQYPVDVRLSGDNKITLKFDRTPELMEDDLYTVQGKYCPNPNNPTECYTWQGSDTTKW